MMDLRLYPTTLATIYEVLRAASAHPGARVPELARFAGLGDSTTTRAVSTAVALGLISRDAEGRLCAVAAAITRAAGDETLGNVMRRALFAYRPFESICEGLALGESVAESTRKTEVLLGIPSSDVSRLDVTLKWAEQLGILRREGNQLLLAVSPRKIVTAAAPLLNTEDVESEAKSRLYVAARLGRELYDTLDNDNRELLAGAVLDIESEPARVVERAGQALENWLREVATASGYGSEAKTMNGAGQLASLLVGKSVIHSHQQKLIDSVSTLRNAKAHHKDKKTLTPWTITTTGAVAAVSSTLAVMRSIYEFRKGNQVL
jgi:predicted transcriptional regulator